MKTALIITTFNRSDLFKQCVDSLLNADLSPLEMIVVRDDASKDNEVLNQINRLAMHSPVKVVGMLSKDNKGIKHSLLECYGYALHHCDLAINLDPDAIVKSNFVTTLLQLKHQHPDSIISGFNCNHPQNPVISSHDGYVLRKHCNGINMLIDKQQYETIIKPALLANGNWDFNSTNKLPFVISKPSVVQHIGANQSTMEHAGGDVACDFKLLSLPQVCLFGIDAHDPAGLLRAAQICRNDVDFGAENIITERLFSGREAYSRWMIQDLHGALPTGDYTHVLTIHPDGYIQNPSAWRDEWLEWDYIGAPWHFYTDNSINGNGGFSLRSKRFIELCSKLELNSYHPEDDVLCRQLRPWFEKEYGIKFAPYEVANRFSIEAYAVPAPGNKYSGQFGFHGFHCTGLPIPPPVRKGASVQRVNRRR
jgi:glycosyltransferase involved in cell wall biosynthesis